MIKDEKIDKKIKNYGNFKNPKFENHQMF